MPIPFRRLGEGGVIEVIAEKKKRVLLLGKFFVN